MHDDDAHRFDAAVQALEAVRAHLDRGSSNADLENAVLVTVAKLLGVGSRSDLTRARSMVKSITSGWSEYERAPERLVERYSLN